MYPSYIATGELPACANWVFMFERTLPNQGGRSLVDNELSDSGAVLAHEIGHQLVSGHCCSRLLGFWWWSYWVTRWQRLETVNDERRVVCTLAVLLQQDGRSHAC